MLCLVFSASAFVHAVRFCPQPSVPPLADLRDGHVLYRGKGGDGLAVGSEDLQLIDVTESHV